MSVKLTDRAVEELKSLVKAEVEAGHMSEDSFLRLMVIGGGCSGFSYRMGFDQNTNETDKIEKINGVKIVVDDKSNLYLDGVEVDFQDGLMGRGFVFNNPNSSGTCGCGSSFSV